MTERQRDDHPGDEILHGYAEGDLPEDRGDAVETHLRICDRCRSEVEELRALLESAADLPRSIEPERDLWPDIESRIRGTEGRWPRAGRGGADTSLRSAAPWLAAAAAVLIAVTAGATLWLSGGEGDAADIGRQAASAPDAGEIGFPGSMTLAGVEGGYRSSVDRLATLVERRQDRLPPEARSVLERNLEIIDRAIRQAERALAEHPSSMEAVRALDRSYQRKIHLLRRSARLTAQL